MMKKEFRIVSGEKINYETSHAILMLGDKYILQLRSNKSMISAPGQWSLFGGMIEPGERPIDAVKREIYEELMIRPKEFKALWSIDYFDPYVNAVVRTWFFVADVSSVWSKHKLGEGDMVKAFDIKDISTLKIPSVNKQVIERFHNEK